MRILFLTNLYPPAGTGTSEERARLVVEGLRRRGHSVVVLTSDFVRAEPWALSPERSVARELRLHDDSGPDTWFPSVLETERHNHGVLRAWLRRSEAEVVHAWNLGGLSRGLLLQLRRAGVPTVLDVGDPWLARTPGSDPWLRWWEGSSGPLSGLLRAAAMAVGWRRRIDAEVPTGPVEDILPAEVLCASERARELTIESGWPLGGAPVLPGPVATEAITPRAEPPRRLRRFLWVSRLQPERDPRTALRALADLRTRPGWEDATLDVYGRGDHFFGAALAREAKSLGLGASVSFRSASPDRLRPLYAEHDALWATGRGLTLFDTPVLEAMAAGIPVFAADEGALSEWVREGETGWLFPQGDPFALAARVVEAEASPADVAARVAAARAWVLAHAATEPYLAALEAAYARALASAGA